MSTYVMSDIHGYCLEFINLLEQIKFSKDDTLYILGDVVDKGPDSIALLNCINKSKNIILIKGNHEAMMLDFLKTNDEEYKENWFINGGDQTYKDYLLLNKKERINIYNMLYSLPLYKEIDVNGKHFFLSHSGLIINPNYNLQELIKMNEVKEECFYWLSRSSLFLDVDVDYLNTIFVFGHNAVHTLEEYIEEIDEDNKKRIQNNQIYKTKNKIDIDIGAAYNMGLACIRLDDLEEFYLQFKC